MIYQGFCIFAEGDNQMNVLFPGVERELTFVGAEYESVLQTKDELAKWQMQKANELGSMGPMNEYSWGIVAKTPNNAFRIVAIENANGDWVDLS